MRYNPNAVIPAHAGIQTAARVASVQHLLSMSVSRGYVYILASQRNGTLYIGVTSNLVFRIRQHKEKAPPGFSSQYGVTRLVYAEEHDRIVDAIAREKQLKKWRRAWKLELIEALNPTWRDLYPDLI